MVEGWLTLLGAQVINLGAQTPTADLIEASEHHRADVVALSFSGSAPAHLVQDALPAFRSRLPSQVEVWAGGRNPLLARRAPAGVLVLDDLGQPEPGRAGLARRPGRAPGLIPPVRTVTPLQRA